MDINGYLVAYVACRKQLVVIRISVAKARLAEAEWPHPQDERYAGIQQRQHETTGS